MTENKPKMSKLVILYGQGTSSRPACRGSKSAVAEKRGNLWPRLHRCEEERPEITCSLPKKSGHKKQRCYTGTPRYRSLQGYRSDYQLFF